MRIEVNAVGPRATGKTYALQKITKLLEELGFTSIRSLTDEHAIGFYRTDNYRELRGLRKKVKT